MAINSYLYESLLKKENLSGYLIFNGSTLFHDNMYKFMLQNNLYIKIYMKM